MQAARQRSRGFRDREHVRDNTFDAGYHTGSLALVPKCVAKLPQVQRHQRQPLAYIVVQLSGDARTLLFLGMDELVAAISQLLFRELPLRKYGVQKHQWHGYGAQE